MHEELLIGLTLIMVASISAQWVAWRIRLPSILLLLLGGIIAGPVTGILHVDELMGELLFPVVSLSVAIILFEGGLSLRLDDLREIGRVVRNLITIGVVITWVLTTLTARYVLNLDWSLSLLIGAILVVTGPTVVIPLLNQIRPAARVSSILRWEGIVIDPVGAVLTVLVFEQIITTNATLVSAVSGLARVLLIGMVLGWLGAQVMVESFRRYWVPDYLQNPVVLAVLVAFFTVSNVLQAESGLLTVTVMGIFMANQKRFDVKHIVEFKENLQVLLISTIFILLGARLEFGALRQLGSSVVIFILVIMFVARPLSVLASTYGSGLSWKEKLFISWMAPRGIVAASIASVFSLELTNTGHVDADLLVPLTFEVIISTVIFYSLTAGVVAKWLGLVQENPQGVIFIGAHSWGRRVAQIISGLGYRVVMVDTNEQNIRRAAAAGLEAHHANILLDPIMEELDLSGIGKLVAMTPNDEVNSLACMHFRDFVGSDDVYQLPHQRISEKADSVPLRLGGNNLFGHNVTYEYLSARFRDGANLEAIPIDDMDEFREWQSQIVPMFLVTRDGRLVVWTANNPPPYEVGQTLIGLIDQSFGE